MRIISYETKSADNESMYFSKMNFARMNLIVGDSATGKTRLLNTIFNCARNVTNKDKFYLGHWDILFEHENKTFHWELETGLENKETSEESVLVKKELIYKVEKNGKEKEIINRTPKNFIFNNKELPKLSPRESAISILQDEDDIKPLYHALSCIKRRNFSGPELDFASSFQDVPQKVLNKFKKKKDLSFLFSIELNLNCALYILSIFFKEIYSQICKEFSTIFPFISDIKMLDAKDFNYSHPGIVPVFSIKEKDIKSWIPLHEISSGMKKVLLILTDLFSLPDDGKVYLIDEYENSLGINAINFFPSVLINLDNPGQFIITSHHPYIIGKIPVKNWIVLHRKGLNVLVKQGTDLEERFGKSKQMAFTQLINDPFFTEGIE